MQFFRIRLKRKQLSISAFSVCMIQMKLQLLLWDFDFRATRESRYQQKLEKKHDLES